MGTDNRFDLLNRRTLIALIGGAVGLIVLVVALILILGGRGGQSDEIASPTPSPTVFPTPTPSPAGPPTETPTPSQTPTLEPYVYTVQAGETLLFIIQQFGYRDLSVVPEILLLNGMASADDIYAGQHLLIPRQTPTPGPTSTPAPDTATPGTPADTGDDGPTPTAGSAPSGPPTEGDYRGCSPTNRCVTPDGQYYAHEVMTGDTISYLAGVYYSRVQDIIETNNLDRTNPIIFEGQIIFIPILVTATPTLTPTGGPDSTATPTPTVSPPDLLAPANGEVIPRSQKVVLQWAATQPLMAGHYYLIILRNTATEEEHTYTTRSNSFRVPTALQPGPGGRVEYQWQIVIVAGQDVASPVVGGHSQRWVFTWGS